MLRTFNENSPLEYCFAYKTSPLIKITKKGEISYYNSENEKISALKTRLKNDKFIIAWAGKWSTDVFEVNEFDIKNILNKTK